MSLSRNMPLDPMDLLGGLLIPEPQLYVLAAGPLDLAPGRVYARLAPLITERFPRLCYRFPRRLGTWSGLALADDPTAPIKVHGTTPEPLSVIDDRPLDDRHWALHVLEHQGLSLLALRFDHVLGHGELGRRFLIACSDALHEREQPEPPRLDRAQQDIFDKLQDALTSRAQAGADWAEYRRLDLDARRVRRLVRAVGMSFSEGLTLWLAHHIQAVNRTTGNARSLEALGFRMDPTTSLEPPLAPETGNRGLLLERWQVQPNGGFERLDKGPEQMRRGLGRFSAAYRALPAKPLVDGLLRLALAAARRRRPSGQDKLVVNNLGRTAYPFFRPIFFDPQNDTDQLGLVYADGVADILRLQFTPPRRYLQHFPWLDFATRLKATLSDPEGWAQQHTSQIQ